MQCFTYWPEIAQLIINALLKYTGNECHVIRITTSPLFFSVGSKIRLWFSNISTSKGTHMLTTHQTIPKAMLYKQFFQQHRYLLQAGTDLRIPTPCHSLGVFHHSCLWLHTARQGNRTRLPGYKKGREERQKLFSVSQTRPPHSCTNSCTSTTETMHRDWNEWLCKRIT